MPEQSVRQQARRVALDARTRVRQQHAERERRRAALAETVLVALAERDAAIAACEARAAIALEQLMGPEGLTRREAIEWCGGEERLSAREVTRLRGRAVMSPTSPASRSEAEPEGDAGPRTE